MEVSMNMNKDAIPLSKLHKNLDKDHWNTVLRKNANLAMIRNMFKRKMIGKLTYHHMSAFLVSSENVPKIHNSAVMNEVDKLSISIMSSRHNFELRRLKPKRKLEKVKDCYMSEHETENIIRRVFTIFRLKNHIGSTNCASMLVWIINIMKQENLDLVRNFVYKEAPFACAFRAKQVLKKEDPLSKRYIQFSIVNNLRGALIWWVLAALRQILIPIDIERKKVYLWRGGYLKLLRREMKDFKQRYKVQRVNRKSSFFIAPSPNSVIGQLQLKVVDDKLRPIILRKPINKMKDVLHWKKVNSMLTWCLEKNGATRHTIHSACRTIVQFLQRNSKCSALFGYTADISKCFSTVNHDKLNSIINRLLENQGDIWTSCGKGRDDKGYHKLFFCSNDSEERANKSLEKRMRNKKVAEHTVVYCDPVSSKWLLEQVRTAISSYCIKRGKTTFRITKGVPQGHPLSSNFAFMYLNDFEKDNWKFLKNDKKIVYCRYEDDYIFVMTDGSLFEKIAEPLFTGKNQHGLKANHEKCKKSDDKLIWCNKKIDLKTAKVYRWKRCADGNVRTFLINFDRS